MIFNQIIQNQEKCNNIKVFARFRPFNKVEGDLTKNGLGDECCLFPDNETAVLLPDNQVFTLDRVFPMGENQQIIYDEVGK